MKGVLRTLHIRCGDDIRDRLVEAGIEGDYLSFADPAWLGPPPASNAWIAGRAALIAERTGLSRQKIRADLGDAYWRLARAPADYGRIVLWGEHDLYDQAALVRVLASFATRKKLPRIELISIDRFRGIKRFIGLGQLSAAQLATLWPRRKPISRRQLALGARVWAALRAPTPEPLDALCKGDLRALPFLKAALQRQLQELPGPFAESIAKPARCARPGCRRPTARADLSFASRACRQAALCLSASDAAPACATPPGASPC